MMYPNSLWGAMRQYYDRGGFVNGMNPAIVGNVWYVDTILGSDSFSGRGPGKSAFATMEKAFEKIANKDIISFSGVVREQLTAPQDIFDITIIGAANTPRQATDGGVATGGGATWLAPTSPTAATPLLKLREQGWSLQNFFMAAETDAACVYLDRQETAAAMDASHFSMFGMVLGGGLYGIQEYGGNGFLQLIGNRFQNFSGSSAYAIRNTNVSIATPLQWQLKGNIFRNNKNHILVPLSQGEIIENDFGIVGNGVTTVIACSLTGGLNNTVAKNLMNRPLNTSPNATLYVGGTNDVWYENYGTDGVFYGVPDNS